MNQHYCNVHKTKYYKNEKKDYKGDLKVWYSHKMADGSGFCTEKTESSILPAAQQLSIVDDAPKAHGMLMCNAMNNAVALAANGKISLAEISFYYKRILSDLMASA